MHKVKLKTRKKVLEKKEHRYSALINGIVAGLTAPAIFFVPPSYGGHFQRNGMHTDFRNVGMYLRSAMNKSKLGEVGEKAKKS